MTPPLQYYPQIANFPVSHLKAHKNCGQMSEIEAKVRYVKLARSLKTYGVSFFLVKVGPGPFLLPSLCLTLALPRLSRLL